MHAKIFLSIVLIALLALSGCTSSPGKAISFSVVSQGTQSSFTVEQQKVFRTQGEFEDFWKSHSASTLLSAMGTIDYGRETLILLAMGEKSTSGYSIRVDRVTQAGNKVQVLYTITSPTPTLANDQVLTQPYILIKVSKKTYPESVQFVGTSLVTETPASQTAWMAYAPVQAGNNPWQTYDDVFVTTPTETERAAAWLASISSTRIAFTTIVFVPHDEITCAALNCPRGDYLYVHASDVASAEKLRQLGFFSPTDPFVIAEKNDASHATLQFVNPASTPIYYGGCNDFTARLLGSGEPVPMPEKLCAWEGYPIVLAAQSEITLNATLSGTGTYDFAIGYGIGCDAAQPLSQGNCTTQGVLYSNALSFDVAAVAGVEMDYALTQCRSNPWQVGEYAITDETDDLKFVRWLNDNGVQALSISLIPSPEGYATCDACSCGTGETYRITVSTAQEANARALGFNSLSTDDDTPSITPTTYSQLTWLVVNPYQCFANKWPVPKQVVKSTETDMGAMKAWLESKGATINELALIRGLSTLNVQCFKRTNDVYAVGVENNSDAEIVRQSGFVYASAAQTQRFSSTPVDDPKVAFVYKTKYCATPAWEVNPTAEADYATSASALRNWLDVQGIPHDALTIHTLPKSPTGSCDTDSGYGMRVLVPKWATYHLGSYGFVTVSTANPASQVYPVIE